MKTKLVSALVLASLATGVFAASPTGFNYKKTRVFQLDASTFEVVPKKRPRVDDYWCAASEFAVRRLGSAWRQRLYVASSYSDAVTTGRPSTIRFTLDPDAAGITPNDGSVSSGFRVGDNMSIQLANTRCNKRPIRDN